MWQLLLYGGTSVLNHLCGFLFRKTFNRLRLFYHAIPQCASESRAVTHYAFLWRFIDWSKWNTGTSKWKFSPIFDQYQSTNNGLWVQLGI